MADTTFSPSGFSGEGLTCIRGERMVFAGLGFAVAAGDALILSGPNGSGKSSLLRLMAGLLPPADGALYRDDHDILADPEAHRATLHYVGHQDAVKPMLTVAENLAFWAGIRHAPQSPPVPQRVADALAAFGLATMADNPARLLSAGQRRRLNLARLIASPAPLWLLDEPAVALDTASVAVLVRLIAAHRENSGIVVLSTHTDLGIEAPQSLVLDDFAVSRAFAP
ncbi:MAG: heme ABC exporter ATP-binding protein CcmA [Alphaproteobacteria bacterium]